MTDTNYELLASQLESSIMNAIERKPLEEIKQLDWFTCNTDFFIEQIKKNTAA